VQFVQHASLITVMLVASKDYWRSVKNVKVFPIINVQFELTNT
jgi:hypothetical protein